MRRFLLMVLVLGAVAWAQTGPPATYDLPPLSGRYVPPTPAYGPFPPFPGAGTVLGTQFMPLFPTSPPPAPQHSPDTLGAAYDRSRSVVWFADQNRTLSFETPSVYSVTPSIPHTIVTTIICYNSSCVSNPGVPVTSSQFTDISIVPSRSGFNGPRSLLAVEFNGDLARFDDHMVEIDLSIPTQPNVSNANVLNVWYLDSASCPASCVPNTNTNTPQERIDPVILVQDMDYIPGETADGRHQVLIGASCGDYRVGACGSGNRWAFYFSELTPGCPGTWRALATHGNSLPVAPFQWYAHFMTFDPDTQSYFISDNANGAQPPNLPPLVYEAKFNRTTRTFRLIQAFTPWDGYVAGMAVIQGSDQPHWMKAVGRRTTSIASLDTGDRLLTLVPSGNLVQLQGGVPNAGKPWLLVVALTANFGFTLPDRERSVGLDPDIVFILSVQGLFGNSGVLDASGNGSYTMPVLPAGTTLQLQGVLLGNVNEDDIAIQRMSQVTPYVAP